MGKGSSFKNLLCVCKAFSGVQVDSSSLPTRGDQGNEVLSFFWLDAYEDYYRQPGTVYLFGKVWVPQVNAHVR